MTNIRTFENSALHLKHLKLIARLGLGLSYPKIHIFNQRFQDTLSAIWNFYIVEEKLFATYCTPPIIKMKYCLL